MELKGSSVEAVPLAGTFTDPGCIATENDEDISDRINVSGTVDTQKPGVYSINYSVNNSDGFPSIIERKVVVYDPTPSPIESGGYYVASSSTRSSKGGEAGAPVAEYKSQPPMVIYQSSPGRFYISDLFGGYYSIGRGYGSRYDTAGIIAYDGTNFSLVSANNTPWGDTFSSVTGTYDEGVKTLVLQGDYSSFTFHLNIVKNQ